LVYRLIPHNTYYYIKFASLFSGKGEKIYVYDFISKKIIINYYYFMLTFYVSTVQSKQ
jgi:hypothetical protein